MIIVGPPSVDYLDVSYVLVGCGATGEMTDVQAVTGSQAWAQLGGKSRDETYTVHCVASAWNGDGNALTAMDAVFALMAGIEAAIVADPSLGGVLVYSPGIQSYGLRFTQDTQGVAAQLPFDVECKSRI